MTESEVGSFVTQVSRVSGALVALVYGAGFLVVTLSQVAQSLRYSNSAACVLENGYMFEICTVARVR